MNGQQSPRYYKIILASNSYLMSPKHHLKRLLPKKNTIDNQYFLIIQNLFVLVLLSDILDQDRRIIPTLKLKSSDQKVVKTIELSKENIRVKRSKQKRMRLAIIFCSEGVYGFQQGKILQHKETSQQGLTFNQIKFISQYDSFVQDPSQRETQISSDGFKYIFNEKSNQLYSFKTDDPQPSDPSDLNDSFCLGFEEERVNWLNCNIIHPFTKEDIQFIQQSMSEFTSEEYYHYTLGQLTLSCSRSSQISDQQLSIMHYFKNMPEVREAYTLISKFYPIIGELSYYKILIIIIKNNAKPMIKLIKQQIKDHLLHQASICKSDQNKPEEFDYRKKILLQQLSDLILRKDQKSKKDYNSSLIEKLISKAIEQNRFDPQNPKFAILDGQSEYENLDLPIFQDGLDIYSIIQSEASTNYSNQINPYHYVLSQQHIENPAQYVKKNQKEEATYQKKSEAIKTVDRESFCQDNKIQNRYLKYVRKVFCSIGLYFVKELVLSFSQIKDKSEKNIKVYDQMHQLLPLKYFVLKIHNFHHANFSLDAIQQIKQYLHAFIAKTSRKYCNKKFQLSFDFSSCEPKVIQAIIDCFTHMRKVAQISVQNIYLEKNQMEAYIGIQKKFGELLANNAETIINVELDHVKLIPYIPFLKKARKLKIHTKFPQQTNQLATLLSKFRNLIYLQLRNLDLHKNSIVEAARNKNLTSLILNDCILAKGEKLQLIAKDLHTLQLVINRGQVKLNFPQIFKQLKNMRYLMMKTPYGAFSMGQFSQYLPYGCKMKILDMLNQHGMNEKIEQRIFNKTLNLQLISCPKKKESNGVSHRRDDNPYFFFDESTDLQVLEVTERQSVLLIKMSYRSHD